LTPGFALHTSAVGCAHVLSQVVGGLLTNGTNIVEHLKHADPGRQRQQRPYES